MHNKESAELPFPPFTFSIVNFENTVWQILKKQVIFHYSQKKLLLLKSRVKLWSCWYNQERRPYFLVLHVSFITYSRVPNRRAVWNKRVGGKFLQNQYRKVASSNTSRLDAYAGFFRLLMKGIFYPYVLWPFDKNLIS